MTWDEADALMAKRVNLALKTTALKFKGDISSASVWPVDTGTSRRAWTLEGEVIPYEHVVSNDVDYSAVLWVGRRFVGNKWQGSLQMPLGGQPIYLKHQRELEDKLKRITE